MSCFHSIFLFLAALLAVVDLRAMDILVRSGVPVGIAADGQAGTVTTAGSLHNGRVAVDNAPDGAWADINVTATGFSDSGHRWVPPASVIPSYDDDGNLLADGRWTYTWDAMNRLVAMASTSNALAAGVPNQTITFAYDFASRRIGKKVTTTNGTGSTVTDTRYLYDGWSRGARRDPRQTADRRPGGRERNGVPLPSTCVAEFEYDDLGDMIPQATYVWSLDLSGTLQGAGGVGGLLSVSLLSSVSASSVFLPCYDANGNIIAWADGNGSPAQRQDYDPFGNLVIVERLAITPAAAARLAYGFSTKPLDAETGLHYYGYRFYDARNGRWINQDPIGENGGLNLYGFVGNGGSERIDALGLSEPMITQVINGTINHDPNQFLQPPPGPFHPIDDVWFNRNHLMGKWDKPANFRRWFDFRFPGEVDALKKLVEREINDALRKEYCPYGIDVTGQELTQSLIEDKKLQPNWDFGNGNYAQSYLDNNLVLGSTGLRFSIDITWTSSSAVRLYSWNGVVRVIDGLGFDPPDRSYNVLGEGSWFSFFGRKKALLWSAYDQGWREVLSFEISGSGMCCNER